MHTNNNIVYLGIYLLNVYYYNLLYVQRLTSDDDMSILLKDKSIHVVTTFLNIVVRTNTTND